MFDVFFLKKDPFIKQYSKKEQKIPSILPMNISPDDVKTWHSMAETLRKDITCITCFDTLKKAHKDFKNHPLQTIRASLPSWSAEHKRLYAKELSSLLGGIQKLFKQQEELLKPKPSKEHYYQATNTSHPIMHTMMRCVNILENMGFVYHHGMDVVSTRNNFDALNVSNHHPSRSSSDTFYLDSTEGYLLRTHTSCVQIDALRHHNLPCRVISAGRVYRRDEDRTHMPMFFQMEALCVEPGIHMGHLKSTLSQFLEQLFGRKRRLRFRPSFFPFTEPSLEIDLWDEERSCWLEVLGAGMVHPHIFETYDPEQHHQGFAFGCGIERLTMLYYGMDSMSMLYDQHPLLLEKYQDHHKM